MSRETGKQIRILIVDDSAFMRKALQMMLESDPLIKVIDTARDGEEGIEKVRRLKPDLVTMDIEMPRMDGLAALREIMATNPTPVMMISSLTTDGASATLDALEMGAVDFIPKGLSYVSLDIVKIKEELVAKIKDIVRRKNVLMARARSAKFARLTKAPVAKPTTGQTPARRRPVFETSVAIPVAKRSHPISIIAIGSSTGGPPALQAVIPRLPRNLPVGVVIAQHMPATFTKSLADRLNSLSQVTVREAEHGDPVEPGTVLIAPGGRHLTVKKHGARASVVISDEPSTTLYKPCVDVTINSIADNYGRATLGIVLTGMGSNGVVGIRNVREKGGIVIAQDEESCVVYGMPRAVIEASLANHVAPIENIASEILSYF